MGFVPAPIVAAAKAGVVKVDALLRIGATPVVRCWSGVGRLTIPEDAVEDDDTGEYYPLRLIGLPVIEMAINGQAARTEFTLNGVSDEVLALAQADSTVRGARANIGLAFFDDETQLIGVWWARQGKADMVPIRWTPGNRSVGVSIGWGRVGRRRPPLSFWTNQYQHMRDAADDGCERTPAYEAATRKWPLWNA